MTLPLTPTKSIDVSKFGVSDNAKCKISDIAKYRNFYVSTFCIVFKVSLYRLYMTLLQLYMTLPQLYIDFTAAVYDFTAAVYDFTAAAYDFTAAVYDFTAACVKCYVPAEKKYPWKVDC